MNLIHSVTWKRKVQKIQVSRINKSIGMQTELSSLQFCKSISLESELYFSILFISPQYLFQRDNSEVPTCTLIVVVERNCTSAARMLLQKHFLFKTSYSISLLHCTEDCKSNSERKTGGSCHQKFGSGEVSLSFLVTLLLSCCYLAHPMTTFSQVVC